MNEITIRKAGVGDVELIRRMAMDIWPGTYTPIIGEQQVAYMLDRFYNSATLTRQMTEEGHRFIIATENETPLAFAAWSETEPGVNKLHKLYIMPELQGKGIGRKMIGYITDTLKNEGVAMLKLNVNRYNATAIRFYEKAGFRKLYDEDIAIGDGYYMNDHVLGVDLK